MKRPLAALLLALLAVPSAPAQEEPPASPPEGAASEGQAPLEVPPGSPRHAVDAFLSAVHADPPDYEAAGEWLALPAQTRDPEEAAPRLARELAIVLERTRYVDLRSLSADPMGDTDDGLDRLAPRDKLTTIPSARGDVDVLLDRIWVEGDEFRWKFAAVTVDEIDRLYEEHGYGLFDPLVAEAPILERRLLNFALFQWLGLAVLVLLGWLGGLAISFPLLKLARHFAESTETEADDQLLKLVASPLNATLAILIVRGGSRALALAKSAQDKVDGLCNGLLMVTVIWLFVRLVDLGAAILKQRMVAKGAVFAATVIPVTRRVTKIFLVIIAGLSFLSNLGIEITGLLAGLGIGGLALALGAEKTFANLFGGVSIIVDQPVRVGDFCRWGDNVGTVEEIGLRSTRIRTLDRTLVTVPNAHFADLQIENFAHRDRVLFKATIGVRYETTAEQMRYLLVELKKLLVAHAKTYPDPARVRFVGFGSSSLDVEVFAYIQAADWNEFLGIREDLLLRMMDVVERAGTGFAFPSQTVYLGRDDGGVDPERQRQATETIEGARAREALDLPDLPIERERELDDTLPWPPEGSSTRKG